MLYTKYKSPANRPVYDWSASCLVSLVAVPSASALPTRKEACQVGPAANSPARRFRGALELELELELELLLSAFMGAFRGAALACFAPAEEACATRIREIHMRETVTLGR